MEGHGRYLRPSHIYFFTDAQSKKTTARDREAWLSHATVPGFRPTGTRWYADTSREQIRDDLMRSELLRMGIMQKRSGLATTSSTPINFLSADFSSLFDPRLSGSELIGSVDAWRKANLDQATLQRMELRARRIEAKEGEVFIDMPDGTRIRISAGLSSIIAKGLIEDFSIRHMEKCSVLWLSESDKKQHSIYKELAASVGLYFDLSAELPDMILAELGKSPRFLICEVVATDGAVTEDRKKALLTILGRSKIPRNCFQFLSAFEDREAGAFRKNFSKLALGTLVWFRTEPDLLVVLNAMNRKNLERSMA